MSKDKLKTAILGLTKAGVDMLDSARKTALFDIIAVADDQTELAEKTARQYQCAWFDDYRQLIIQNQLDVLFVATPIHLCIEHIRSAMKKKFNIVTLIPPAIDFEQLAELGRLAKKEKVHFVTASSNRFSPPFCELRDYLRSDSAQKVHLITAVCNTAAKTDDSNDRWLSDPQLAGGGVLLRNCYEIIDQIILCFGLAQQVYSLNTNQAPDKQQRLLITEDTAVVTMKFSDTLMGNLITSRVFGPPAHRLTLHCRENYLTVTEDNFTISDNLGNIIRQTKYENSSAKAMTKMLENFAMSILSPNENTLFADITADLNTMAVIGSAYLSARTAAPEEPTKILTIDY